MTLKNEWFYPLTFKLDDSEELFLYDLEGVVIWPLNLLFSLVTLENNLFSLVILEFFCFLTFKLV